MNEIFRKKSKDKSPHELAIKMAIALLMAVLAGSFLILCRERLIANGNEATWNFINRLLFQDISKPEGADAIGIFYILGQLFINSLQLIIIPMVFSSIALAMCNISDTKKLGRISSKTILGFLATSIFALIVAGLFGFMANRLGFFNVSVNGMSTEAEVISSSSNPLLILVDIIPNNISTVLSDNSRVLSIVFLAVVTGLSINTLGEKISVLKNLLEDINKIITVFLNFVINKFTPIAVFILITRTFAVYGTDYLKPAMAYMITVAITAILFFLIGYPLFILITTKLNPLIFMKKMMKVALLGFSAASSAAALSLNQKTTVEELGVSKDVASFTIPLGMTINMNGTAIMQVIATIFIASSSGYYISIGDIIVIAILALIASVGTPAAPGSSTIILFTVLTGMGYSNGATLIAYSLIIAINRPIDMLITCLNVTGDAATAVAVAASEDCLDEAIYNS